MSAMTAMLLRAAGLFAVTNLDDIVILALFFGQASTGGAARVVAGQYLGFAGILVAAVGAASGAGLLPETVLAYLGLLPLLLGLRAAWSVWGERRSFGPGASDPAAAAGALRGGAAAPGILTVAAVTLANGADNLGVYVPVFAASSRGAVLVYVATFFVLVGVWCVVGYLVASRAVVARVLSRSGHVVLPVVLVGIGVALLVEGGAFGL
jgi:cadmium resistance protein CadD (predicted permease)